MMLHNHLLLLSEQLQGKRILNDELPPEMLAALTREAYSASYVFNPQISCFEIIKDSAGLLAHSSYMIGVDWIEPRKAAIYVEPKLNGVRQVNYLKMLIDSLEHPENLMHLDGLFHVQYDRPWISIPEQKDLLSPLLIVQFLNLLKSIVRKGLKKSYYRVTENLNSRIKGKILVGRQIKENLIRNRPLKTICNYQDHGANTEENQYLKLVLEFVVAYLSNRQHFFSDAQNKNFANILNYCIPAFHQVEVYKNKHQKVNTRNNVLFSEYGEAIRIGECILKQYSFHINKASQTRVSTPPFWIDMSKLFELYVFGKLKEKFAGSNTVTYHDEYLGGKQTDILIRNGEFKCVVECKYKNRYESHSPNLEDKRQLTGYVRLKSVYKKLGVPYDKIIKGVIIFPNQSREEGINIESLFKEEIKEYVDLYKLGIRLPELNIH